MLDPTSFLNTALAMANISLCCILKISVELCGHFDCAFQMGLVDLNILCFGQSQGQPYDGADLMADGYMMRVNYGVARNL